jgi:hypothetical protein
VADASEEDLKNRRRLKFRQRDDYALELFKEAQDNLADAPAVDRILVLLGRFYNPYLDAPIVDLDTRRAVLEALERGEPDVARRLLEERLRLYARFQDAE